MSGHDERPKWPVPRGERGFTLIEVVLSVMLIAVGLVAVATGFPMALSGVEMAKRQSVAALLAEERLEQVKATPYPNITAANFPDENYGTFPNAPNHRRTVTITPNPGGTTELTLVQVTVAYRAMTVSGFVGERQVTLATVVANRL